jgi:integrase
MATFKFVLSKSQHQRKINSKSSMLMLRYTHKKQVVLFTTGKNIEDKFWDDKNQIVKRGYPSSERFNIIVRNIRKKVEDIASDLQIAGEDPNVHHVKQIYESSRIEKETKIKYSFFEYAELYLEKAKKHKNVGTIKTYQTTINKLKEYEKYSRKKVDWNTIDMEFYYDFFEFYTGIQGFLTNGFGRVIKIMKVILNDATENGYNINLKYQNKNFRALREEVNNIYLSDVELEKIINLDLNSEKHLEKVRDLFIVGCYTGLRFSDFSQIKKENIIDGKIIRLKTIKTDEWVTIPLMDEVAVVMKRYKDQPNSLPKSFDNQVMNRYLKDIGELAGIKENFLKVRNKGKDRFEESFKKYELITTHTARRSFATNMFKRGVPSRVIMKITGHRTEKAFSSYIKITEDENAELMLKHLEAVN